ncbi:hypothetical protein [Kineosporia sp. A_224]|uniref:hypothetical protein n=1 Tax=Kineosporia sp. A_224 TaxID=1962180 RepID=UPI000B4B36CE|nr:hypothetical protein [Kineosporia sp. A_224]
MTTPVTSPLRYVLSATALTVGTTLRLAVVSDDRGGHLEPEVVVSLGSLARVRPVASAQSVPVEVGSPAWTVPGSLRRVFDKAHPRTAALAADLAARAEQFLAGLRMSEDLSEVVTIGQALEVVHRELAAADRMRREWVAGQGHDVRTSTWDLGADDLLPVEGAPRTLPAGTALPSETADALAREYGVLVALTGGESDSALGGSAVAVYRRPPAGLPEGATAVADDVWRRDDALSHLQLIETSGAHPVAPGVVPAPRAPEDRWVGSGHVPSAPAPEAALAAVEIARTQLELLQGSDEYARLAATHHRAEELVALEHEARLADGRTRRA